MGVATEPLQVARGCRAPAGVADRLAVGSRAVAADDFDAGMLAGSHRSSVSAWRLGRTSIRSPVSASLRMVAWR